MEEVEDQIGDCFLYITDKFGTERMQTEVHNLGNGLYSANLSINIADLTNSAELDTFLKEFKSSIRRLVLNQGARNLKISIGFNGRHQDANA